MDVINIQIPAPDFLFSDVVRRKAEAIIDFRIKRADDFGDLYFQISNLLMQEINSEFYLIKKVGDRVIFILTFITHINDLKAKLKLSTDKLIVESPKKEKIYLEYQEGITNSMDEFLFHLYNFLTDCGYNLDTESFSIEQAKDFDDKIDKVLDELENLRIGQSVLGDVLEELKDHLNSIKNGKPLGKTLSIQRLQGLASDYVFNKLTDFGVNELKILLLSLIIKHPTELTEPIIKLLAGKN